MPDYKMPISAYCPVCEEPIDVLIETEEAGSIMGQKKQVFAHPIGYARPCGHHFMRDVFDVLKAQLTSERDLEE